MSITLLTYNTDIDIEQEYIFQKSGFNDIIDNVKQTSFFDHTA